MEEEETKQCNFKFTNYGIELELPINDANQAQCPECKCKFRQLLQHLKKSTKCNSKIENFESFQEQYKLFGHRRRQINLRKRKLEANTEELHKAEALYKKEQRKRQLKTNAEELHRDETTWKRNQRRRKVESNPEELHRVEASVKRNQRARKVERNPDELRRDEATMKRKQRERKVENNPEELCRVEATKKRDQRMKKIKQITQSDRLKNFKRAVVFGTIFVCSCCYVKHFECNV